MTSFISWYLLITLLGWLTFPLAYRLFPALADRGYTLARAAGLLIWGYIFWLSASLGISQNDIGGILLALAVVIGLSIWSIVNHQSEIANWLKSQTSLIIITEILFFISFAFLAIVRASNPELTNAEKPMELAFINAILRSPTFPPRDPWLSGYAISYYYFGYVMTAMLARLTSVPGSMAHNLMTSLIFGLGAIGSYGIMYNLLALNNRQSSTLAPHASAGVENRKSLIRLPFLAPLFLLLVSNFEGFFEILYRRGIFWTRNPATSELVSPFWKWLDLKEMTDAPAPLSGGLWERLGYWLTTDKLAGIGAWVNEQFMPIRHYLWWWRASRVIGDYSLHGQYNDLSPIDEFPFFSFLHADLHPHVLAIPFGLLAIAVALHLFLGGWRGTINLFGERLHINPIGFFFSALVLGGMAFLNTWDILIAAALIVFAYVLARANEDGWRWNRLEDLLLLGLPLGLTAIIFYLPFYVGFSSQAGGILPNLINPTRGAHLWVMFAPLFIPLYAWLIYLWRVEKIPANWKRGFTFGMGLALFLWVFALLLGWLASLTDPDFVKEYLVNQGVPNISTLILQSTLRRLSYIGSLISLLAVLMPTLAFLFNNNFQTDDLDDAQSSMANRQSQIVNRKSAIQFVLLLIFLATLLVVAPEFVYLRDQFGYRINTIFKFYYQAWILWSLAAAFGVGILLQKLRGTSDVLFRIVIGLVIMMGLIYPVFSLPYKTSDFNPAVGYSLDDFDRVQRENPDEAAAIQWLQTAPEGVVSEAVGGSYSNYARVSTYSGLPTVLGWPGHESQWRGGYAEQGSRNDDISQLYTTSSWEVANEIIQRYNIRYIYLGTLERTSMRVQEEKFKAHLHPVFQQGNVVIYEVP